MPFATAFIYFSPLTRNLLHEYTMGSVKLKKTNCENDLGILIDNELKFHLHTAKVAKKCKSLLAIIKRSFTCLNKSMIIKLYKAMIRPVIEYGNCIWGPFYKGDIDMVEKLQRRATKLVPELKHIPYGDRLKKLNLPTLKHRRTRGDMITLYKMITGKIQTDKEFIQVERKKYQTRGHPLRLKKILSLKRERRNHLISRAVNKWNALPEMVVFANSTNTFKNQLDVVMEREKFEMV